MWLRGVRASYDRSIKWDYRTCSQFAPYARPFWQFYNRAGIPVSVWIKRAKKRIIVFLRISVCGRKCLLDVSVTLNIIFFQTLIGPSPSGHDYKDLSKPMSIITQIQSTNVRSACMISYSGNVVYKGRPAGSRVMRSPLFPPDLGLTDTCQWEHHLRNSNQR